MTAVSGDRAGSRTGIALPLAVTMGDPAGIGPEIISLALEDPVLAGNCIVVGNLNRLESAAERAGSTLSYRKVDGPADRPGKRGTVPVIDLPLSDPDLPYGRLSPVAGDCAYRCLTMAIDMAMEGVVSGIVTAPLNKESLNMAGYSYPGHTEILAERTGTEDYVMMLVAGVMRVLHVTTHIPLARVPEELTTEKIVKVLMLGNEALVRMGIAAPRLGVAGLNPHAGEGGIFGDEESRIILPAIEAARSEGIDASGPVPPDTVFLKMNRGGYDAVAAMYHDQGHIPLKLLAFESGVNVTLGLPVIRTSVDHGTAFDIAGKGLADPGSLIEAIRLAASMAGHRDG